MNGYITLQESIEPDNDPSEFCCSIQDPRSPAIFVVKSKVFRECERVQAKNPNYKYTVYKLTKLNNPNDV